MNSDSVLSGTPTLDLEAVAELAADLYGRGGDISGLPSERDQNFLVRPRDQAAYVIKVGNALEDPGLVDLQQEAHRHLARVGLPVPSILETKSGETSAHTESSAGRHPVWAISFLPGRPLGRVVRRTTELFEDLGRSAASMDRALESFDHPTLHRDFHWDLARAEEVVRRHVGEIHDSPLRCDVETLFERYEQLTAPRLASLRRSAIHNDLNDFNVLVGGGQDGGQDRDQDFSARYRRVVGIVDFGDMVHSYLIGELAVALAYAMLDQPDPLTAMAAGVRGYAAVLPPTEDELSCLFGLIGLRLCLSACNAAHQQSKRPDNAYLGISQGPIRRLLPRLAAIEPAIAEAAFRRACGLDPLPVATAIEGWLKNAKVAPILGIDLAAAEILDLGPASTELGADPSHHNTVAHDAGPKLGRYGEIRLHGEPTEPATPFAPCKSAFLGLDLWTTPEAEVFAPLDGSVASLAAGVIELRHESASGSLRVRLAGLAHGDSPRQSLGDPVLSLGDPVRRGQRLGTLSARDDGSARLRVHLVVDHPGFTGPPPNFSRPDHFPIWSRLCLDPNLLMRLDADRFPTAQLSSQEALASRRRHLGPSLSLSYRQPVHLARGWRQYLWDTQGRRYLDAYNNVPHVGHCHPRVIEAALRQMSLLNTNTRYLHDTVNAYAERLAGLFPDPLEVCFFLNSATEANELALRLARAATGQRDVIVQEAAYHGHTTTLIDISPYKHAGPGGEGAPAWVHTVPIPDVYRGPYGAGDPLAGSRYAQSVAELIARLEQQGARPSAFIAETCPSVGGQIMMPQPYLEAVYASVRAAGGLTIADEVQTGHGRIGTHLWAFEAHDVIPDIVVLGKPIGNGHPLAAVITTREIAESFDTGMEFFSTFGGNTVSCAVGLAVLDVLEQEGLQAHALSVGERLIEGLCQLQERFSLIGDVRGSGLFLGIELVRDLQTLEPAGEEASFIASRLRELGVLIGTEGPHHNVLKVRPPMPFDTADADALLAALDQVLSEDFAISS